MYSGGIQDPVFDLIPAPVIKIIFLNFLSLRL